MTPEPLFDNVRTALKFALNQHAQMPSPVMNKMAADGNMQRIELADGSRITITARAGSRRHRGSSLKGLDAVAQAGMILWHLARLNEPQQLVLIASSMPPDLPCSCGAQCCSGGRPNKPWTNAVSKLCDYLKEEAQLSRIPGKKGMSTDPVMRLALVQKFFIPGREIILAKLAELCGVTEQTVIKHRRPIITFLETQEHAGWRAIDEHLTTAGIVGDPG